MPLEVDSEGSLVRDGKVVVESFEAKKRRELAHAIAQGILLNLCMKFGPVRMDKNLEEVSVIMLVIVSFLGFLGIDRFYGGKRKSGVVKLALGVVFFILTGMYGKAPAPLTYIYCAWLLFDFMACWKIAFAVMRAKLSQTSET